MALQVILINWTP